MEDGRLARPALSQFIQLTLYFLLQNRQLLRTLSDSVHDFRWRFSQKLFVAQLTLAVADFLFDLFQFLIQALAAPQRRRSFFRRSRARRNARCDGRRITWPENDQQIQSSQRQPVALRTSRSVQSACECPRLGNKDLCTGAFAFGSTFSSARDIAHANNEVLQNGHLGLSRQDSIAFRQPADTEPEQSTSTAGSHRKLPARFLR